MKKSRIIIPILAVLILTISFFCSSPAEKEVPESAIQSSEVLLQTSEPTNTPEVNTEKEDLILQSHNDASEKKEETPLKNEESVADATEKLFCTLFVRCDGIFDNITLISEAKREIIPQDGIIYPEQLVEFSDGESAFDVLLRELRKKEIHIEFVDTPMYNSVYIEGIGNLYEFDCGDMSGWQYRVNGTKPNYGSSQYKLKNGDSIEFYYTTNFMKDR